MKPVLGAEWKLQKHEKFLLKLSEAESTGLLMKGIIQIVVFGSLIQDLVGQGILAYKNKNFHSDESAHILPYESIEPEGFVTWALAGGKRIRFEKTQFHTWVDLPSELPRNIASEAEIKALKTQLLNLETFRKRFAKSQPVSQATYDLLCEASKKLESDLVRHEGNWITSKAFSQILEKQLQADIAAQKRVEERRLEQIRLEELKILAEREKMKNEDVARERRRAMRIQDIEDDIRVLDDENVRLRSKIDQKFSEMAKIVLASEKSPN